MVHHLDSRKPKRSLFTILLPTILTLALLISIIYGVVIPAFENSFLEGKKSTIKQLTSVVMDIMVHYDHMISNKQLTTQEAQNLALREIESLRYGETKQDYFWICDLQPKMVMHPYSKEMIGADLHNYTDSNGTKIFLTFIELVTNQQSGFVYHTWHTKYYDQTVSPKLSYVTKFDPWGWIIGTGVYLDDVKKKTDQIYAYLSKIALGVVGIVALLFFYLARQSLIHERRRFEAESELIISREKYKTLVESATEPMMMFFDNRCIYSNSSMHELSDLSFEDLDGCTIDSLFPEVPATTITQQKDPSNRTNSEHETVIQKKDGSSVQVRINISEKFLGKEKVVMITAHDLSGRRRVEEELGISRQRYQWLTNQLQIGIFRTSSTNGFTILEANPIALGVLGISSNDLGKVQLSDMYEDQFDAGNIENKLFEKSVIKDEVIPIQGTKGVSRMVSLSMVITRDRMDRALYCDGIVEDISLQQVKGETREDLLTELQSSMMFLNDPVEKIIGEKTSCSPNITVEESVQRMVKNGSGALLLQDDSDTVVGVFGDREIRAMVLNSYSPHSPVSQYMNTDLNIIDDSTPVFEAVLMMGEQKIDHLCVKNNQDVIIGLISDKDLLQVHHYSATFLLREIQQSETLEEIVSCHKKLPGIVKALSDSGVNAQNITRIITSIADSVFDRIMEFSLDELGAPPVPFVIIGLGSEGRGEQTLATDQDNALVFTDVPSEQFESVQQYFLRLGHLICHSLDKVGYVLCKGEIMAMNPRWCQPLGVWKDYFSNWIANSTPQDLMELNIFFDYRPLYGESEFVDEIRGHVQKSLRNRPVFYHLMAENNLLFKIPLDFFGNISVETEGKHTGCFNIKHVIAMIVGFARIHSIKHALKTSNTLERLEILRDKGALQKEVYNELVDSYDYLMQLRFRHQVLKIDSGEAPDNWVNLSELTHMEKDLLKKIFAKVATLRKKLTGKGDSNIFF